MVLNLSLLLTRQSRKQPQSCTSRTVDNVHVRLLSHISRSLFEINLLRVDVHYGTEILHHLCKFKGSHLMIELWTLEKLAKTPSLALAMVWRLTRWQFIQANAVLDYLLHQLLAAHSVSFGLSWSLFVVAKLLLGAVNLSSWGTGSC